MDIPIKLSKEQINEIAQEVIRIQSENITISKTPNPERIYTVNQIAALTGKNRRTIEIHLKLGILKGNKPASQWIITQEAFNQYKNPKN